MLYQGKVVISTLAFSVEFNNAERSILAAATTPWKIGDDLPKQQEGVVYLVNARVAGDNPQRLDLVQFDPNHPDTTRDENGRVVAQGGLCRASDLLPKK